MWYVIQTLKGKEYEATDNIREHIATESDSVFVLENEKMFRLRGQWIIDRKPLFPGYLFVETLEPEDFNYRLRKKYHPLKLLQVDGKIASIRPDEEEYLLLLGGEEHVVKYSEGFRTGNKIEITSGSFKGYQGEIIKLDRHNRSARIKLPLMGQNVEVEIGLGIVKSC